jgi:hypothetical protein
VALQAPNAALHPTIVAGAVAPRVAPQVAPPAGVACCNDSSTTCLADSISGRTASGRCCHHGDRKQDGLVDLHGNDCIGAVFVEYG